MDDIRKKLDKMEDKIDEVQVKISDIDITLVKNTISLDQHIRRTELAEEAIAIIRDELKPIQTHVTQVHSIFKVIGFIAVLVGIGAGIAKMLEFSISFFS